MRINVDLDLCQGHAACVEEAPGIFTVPKHGKVEILCATPDPEQHAAVRAAVRYCPTQALSIDDSDS